MATILDYCAQIPKVALASGDVLLREGETSGRLFVLIDGVIEVARGATAVAIVAEPGSIFGEMSVLLNLPHTATVKAMAPSTCHAIENADAFLKANPETAFFLARLLAQRLNGATTYLVDLKRQFEGHRNHLGMVGEVLETLIHQQEQIMTPGSDLRSDPRM